ncbi:uncharacterized protein LOC135840143 isoform X2 [Planococcus citri]
MQKQANSAAESADEEDEISVGCPSPIARSNDDSKEDDKFLEKESRLRSSSCSSVSSTQSHCQQSSNSFSYHSEETIEKENGRVSESDNGSRRYSMSDDETVPKEGAEEYFKPLKRLKMMKIDKTSFSISERSKSNLNKRLYRHHKVADIVSQTAEDTVEDDCNSNSGVKSFSICDILSHKPAKSTPSSSKIVRPWDCEPQEESPNPYLLPPPAHRGILPQPPLFLSQFHPQQLSLHLHRPKSEDISSTYESCSSSGRSSTGGSDCCTSPDVLNCSIQNSSSNHQHSSNRGRNIEASARSKTTNGKSSNSSPLDALFQMTNKTFDELNGDPNAENGNHLNLFNNRQQPKKKRKSRTAFTNNQIFELERRFIYQKYLSPADRDEIATQLGLSNAQVITWFQNRRAKLKRDMEELKKDVESSKVLTTATSFLENVQNFGILKKKPTSHSECKHIENDK